MKTIPTFRTIEKPSPNPPTFWYVKEIFGVRICFSLAFASTLSVSLSLRLRVERIIEGTPMGPKRPWPPQWARRAPPLTPELAPAVLVAVGDHHVSSDSPWLSSQFSLAPWRTRPRPYVLVSDRSGRAVSIQCRLSYGNRRRRRTANCWETNSPLPACPTVWYSLVVVLPSE